jgi:bile acid-coenzyme A ligase
MNRVEGNNAVGGSNTALSDILRFHAERDPDRPALTMFGQDMSRAELDRRTNRLARAYMGLGVGAGDFVTIALPNGFAFFEACFAAWKCGAVPNPVSAKMPLTEMQAMVDLCRPRLMVGGPDALRWENRVPDDFESDPLVSDAPVPTVVSPHWKALGSGGSTGRPKLIVSHTPAQFDAIKPLFLQQLDGITLNPGPLYHNGPFMSSFQGLFCGNRIVNMARFDEEECLRLIEQYRVDFMFLVPTMMNRIWRLGPEIRGRYDLSSVRFMMHTASICPVWLKQAWIDWLGPEKIFEGYGATEQHGAAAITGTEWLEHKGSVGKAVPGYKILILDLDGNPLPAGEIGEIYFVPEDPNQTTYHYIGAEPRTKRGGDSPGDMGYLDAEGYLFIADRRTDMIVSGGSNIYPAEVEAALGSHSQVRSSAVIGLPHEDLISAVHAIVEVAPGADLAGVEADLRSYLKSQLVPYKIPRTFEFVHHPLRDDAGKVRRSQLREERQHSRSE